MALDFFERQRRARAQTARLRVVFALALGLSSVLVAGGLVLVLSTMGFGGLLVTQRAGRLVTAFSYGGPGWWIAAGVMAYSLSVTIRTALGLRRGGGGSLARSLGARTMVAETGDPAERRLRNVIEEMAIAASTPPPQVWVLDREASINAFAAGTTGDDAAIGITAGALRELDRDELQAVIGHEFSHILNGDMALNTRLVSWLSGLFAIETLSRRLKDWSGGSRLRFRLFFWSWHLAVWILHACGYVGLFIGRALQAAICRQRELLADASAVQFTRNAEALKSALLKIEAVNGTRPVLALRAAGMAHMFFASGEAGVTGWLARLREAMLETHPSIADRVRTLDTSMTEAQVRAAVRIVRKDYLGARPAGAPAAPVDGRDSQDAEVGPDDEETRQVKPPVRLLVPDLACSRLNGAQQDAVLTLRIRIGADPADVQAAFVAALVDPQPARARRQLLRLAPLLGTDVAARVPRLAEALAGLPAIGRYPLLEGLVGPLTLLPGDGRARLLRVAHAYLRSVTPFDALRFAALRLLLRSLKPAAAVRAGSTDADSSPRVESYASAAAVLCAVMAQCGATDAEAARAYIAGLDGLLPPRDRPGLPATPLDAGAVDQALQWLAPQPYAVRAAVGAALLRVVAANGTLEDREFDLLRALCGGLAIPVPGTGKIRREPDVSLRRVARAPGV